MSYSLCQDCLKLNDIHPTNEGICSCGGDTCSCNSCQRTIILLQEGCLDSNRLELIGQIVSWTPNGGCFK